MPLGSKRIARTLPSNTHALLYFFLFALTNAVLSYSSIPLEAKLWVGLIGILVPLLIALWPAHSRPKPRPKAALSGPEDLPRLSPFLFIPLLLLAAFLRFFRMGDLSVWPMWDDAHYSFFAIDLAQHWHWEWFFGQEQYTPLYTCLQGLYYGSFEPSLRSMWAFPALLSLFLFPLSYFAARPFFSPAFCALYSILFAFGFWPFYITRFSTDITLCLVLELGAFWLLGLLAKPASKGKDPKSLYAVALGSMAGVGWFFSKFWMANIPILFLLMVYLFKIRSKEPSRALGFFTASFLITFSPMLWLLLTGRYGSHIQNYFVLNHSLSDGHDWGSNTLSYLSALLWGPLHQDYFNFGPFWGGFLNPLLGSAFLMGLLEIGRRRGLRFLFLTGSLFFIYLLPGIFSTTLEMMRIAPVLPVLFLVITLGIRSLTLKTGPSLALGAVLFAGSFALDLHHLCGPYHQWAIPGPHSGDSKSLERYRAFQALDQVQAKEGPGWILTEFVPNVFDQSLLVATYPFNAARNPSLRSGHYRWAALLADDSFRPYLLHRFPLCRVVPLSPDSPAWEPPLSLFVFPLEGTVPPSFQKWLTCHRDIQDLFASIPYHVAHPDLEPALRQLDSFRSAFQGDAFLECCYGAKLRALEEQDLQYRDRVLQSLAREIEVCAAEPALKEREGYLCWKLGEDLQLFKGDDISALRLFDRALQKGYESPGLYEQMAKAEIRKGDFSRALWALRQDLRLDPQHPPPASLIRAVQDHLKNGAKPKRSGP